MLDNNKIQARLLKNDEKRHGVSLVYLPTAEVLSRIHKWLDELDEICGNIFRWYPVFHLSLVRCKSVMQPFVIKDEDLLKCDNVRKEKTSVEKAVIGNDGILRLCFSDIKLEKIEDVHSFYTSNSLKYDIVKEPWMSLGLIDNERENADEVTVVLETRFANGLFPSFDMVIDELSAVCYSDILLKKYDLVKRIYLK